MGNCLGFLRRKFRRSPQQPADTELETQGPDQLPETNVESSETSSFRSLPDEPSHENDENVFGAIVSASQGIHFRN
jgi:hypothetical protein